jgi:hypothetical protein
LQNFRLGILPNYRRVFAHPADIFFQRGIANLETLEMASLSVEPCEGAHCIVSVFEVPNKDMMQDGIPSRAFLERESEFDIVTVPYLELDSEKIKDTLDVSSVSLSDLTTTTTNVPQGIVCQRSTDEAYIERWGLAQFDTNFRQHGIDTIWNWSTDSGIRPCAVYLRHCYLAAQNLGDLCLQSFLKDTFLVDRQTTIGQYLERHPEILETMPPPELAVRYGG